MNSMNPTSGQRVLAFLGCYAEPEASGIYACEFDAKTGSLTIADEAAGLKNPSFLAVDPDTFMLYAIAEGTDAAGQRTGAAASYRIDAATAKLTFLNQEATVPAPTCHIALDQTRQCMVVASYHGGLIGLLSLQEDGRIGQAADIHRHTGSSVLPVQDRPRAHSVTFDRNNRFAVVCDLGLDRLKVYRFDPDQKQLTYHGETAVAPGAGPRHFVFHPTLSTAYVINELNSTVTAFAYDEEQGSLAEIQTVPTLPDTFEGTNSCADIHVSPDGRYLYGSNRGHDSIVVYQIDGTDGKLTLVEHVSTGGEHPRNFALSPDGAFLLAANMNSNNIVTFARDAETGKLTPNGQVLQVNKPVCFKFLTL